MTINTCCIICRAFFPSCEFSLYDSYGLQKLDIRITDDYCIQITFIPDIFYGSPSTYEEGTTNVTEDKLVKFLKN